MGEEFPRQTFNKVLKAQQEIRETLNEWSEENKVIDSDDTEEEFRETLSQATLGLCGQIEMGPGVHSAWSSMRISKIVTILLNSDSPKLLIGSKYDTKEEKRKVPIGYIWGKIKERLNERVFDQALAQAVKISPEREGMKDNMPNY